MWQFSSQRLAACLLAFSVLGILWFGLESHGFQGSNQAVRDRSVEALSFSGSGFASAENLSIAELASAQGDSTILLSFLPDQRSVARRFQFILALGDGDDQTQFIIAQWLDQLVVMRGDDYDYADRAPRLTGRFDASGSSPVLLALRMTADSSELRINNETVATLDTNLLPTATGANLSLRLGESAELNKSWSGAITGLAVFSHRLSDDSLASIYRTWTAGNSLTDAATAAPVLLYDFAGGSERVIPDVSGNERSLLIPPQRALLQPKFAEFEPATASLSDVVLNLLGFIPLGFSLAWLLKTRGTRSTGRILLITTAAGFLLSGGIELTQGWMPARTSSLLDLLLNVAGSMLGGLIFCWTAEKLRLYDNHLNIG